MNKIFTTTDICLAAYLITTHHKLDHISKEGLKGTFHFENVDPVTVTGYDTGHALVEPQAFHNAIRQLTTAVRRPA